jgi:hypothetical protein
MPLSTSSPATFTAAALSPPPTTVKPSILASARATSRVPAENAWVSNRPIGPFQKTVFALNSSFLMRSTVFGADVEGHVPLGHGACRRRRGPPGVDALGADDVDREHELHAFGSAPSPMMVRASGELVLLDEALLPIFLPCAARKVLAIAPPMRARRHLPSSASTRRSCRSPWRRRGSPRRASRALCTTLPSALSSRSSSRPAARSRTSLAARDRGVRPVHRAEGVVYVDVARARRARARSPRRWPPPPGGSGGSRAGDLVRRAGRMTTFFGRVADAVVGDTWTSISRQLGEPRRRTPRVLRVGAGLGRPRCEARTTFAPCSIGSGSSAAPRGCACRR